MYKKYDTEINVTAIARDYIEHCYNSLSDFIEFETDELSYLINVYPELEDDIREEAMRLITIDYCKKKVAEKETKEAEDEPKKLKENSEYSPFSLLGIL